MKNSILKAVSISKFFDGVKILDQLSLDIFENDFTVIMGPSGAGKSTLLYALSGTDSISSGEIFYKNRDISKLSESQMEILRSQDFGFVFQQTHLVSNLTLFENVAVAGFVSKKFSESEIILKSEKLLEQMNVGNAKIRFPNQVSGGEAQRAAIARAMICEPTVIFADEPTGALNKSNSIEVLDLLSKINKAGQSILMVTHDLKAALRANRILYLEDGHILSELELPNYIEESSQIEKLKAREEKVSAWLSNLRW